MKDYRSVMFWFLWLVIAVIAIIPVWYFFSHICDSSFLDSSMGNWFATMIGAIIGIPIALWITRVQQKEQERREAKRREERLHLFLERVKLELRSNRNQVKELRFALTQSSHARADLWEWTTTIVDSFSFAAYNDLIETGLHRLLPQEVEDGLYSSYNELTGLLHKVRQAKAELMFVYGHGGDKKRLDQRLNDVQSDSQNTLDQLDNALSVLDDYQSTSSQ